MVRNHKRTTNQSSWSEESLKNASSDIRSKHLSVKAASKKYAIPRTTLTRHVKNKVTAPGTKKLGKFQTVFSIEVEKQLVNNIKEMQIRFFGLTRENLCSLAFEYATANNINNPFNKQKKAAGKDWLDLFLKRHPELSLRQPEATSVARATGFNKIQVARFYSLLKGLIEENDIPAEKIFNIDETGMSTVQKPGKIIAQKGLKQVGKLTSAERGKTVNAICCMNSLANFIPPLFIFPCKRMNPLLMNDAPLGAKGCVSTSGWTDGNIFLEWLMHFQKATKSNPENQYILILDNHASHVYLPAINFARRNIVRILSIPPHTSPIGFNLLIFLFWTIKNILQTRS